MLSRWIEFSLRNRLLVILFFSVLMGAGAWRLTQLPIDAFPDTTPVQVQVNTVAPALSPEEIEQQITLPVELSISGLPGLENVRSISKFGFSQVVATFSDGTDIYRARQFVMERTNTVELPPGIDRPQLGPIATGLGEVFHYMVTSSDPRHTLTELRTLHDWVIKPALLTVPGVAEVNSWGGYEKEYHVIAEPASLIKHGLTLGELETALRRNNTNVGGGQIERAGEALLVHGVGRVTTEAEIGDIVIKAHQGAPIRVRDVAAVTIGHEIRRGAVTYQGQGEAVLGLGFMLMGENSARVTAALGERLDNVKSTLPEGIRVDIVYDRTELVDQIIGTVSHNLLAGAVLVIVVLFLLLGNVRAGLLVAFTIPMAMLCAVLGMYELSIAASLLSLGAIDFGIIVDGSVVMTESNLRRLRKEQQRLGRRPNQEERLQCIIQSSQEVARPIAFGMGIILLVFAPILALEGIEAKLFRPMAWTFMFALAGALIIALLLSPILSYYLLPWNARPERKGLAHALAAVYGWALRIALRIRWVILAATIALIACAGLLARNLGGEFLPRLSEGAAAINVIRLAGVSLESSSAYNTRIERLLLETFPDEINYVWSRTGSAEVATDPMGIELTDIFITLHPRDQWQRADRQTALMAAMEETLSDLPGLNLAFSQPIEMRLNEMVSGIRSDLGIKIFGDDFEELTRISDDIQRILVTIDGTGDITADQLTGQPTVQVKIDPERIARHNVSRAEILDFVRAMGGIETGKIYEGIRVFPLVLRLPDAYRTDVDVLRTGPIPTESGLETPLGHFAHVREIDSPSTINREWGRRVMRVQANVRGRDTASFAAEAQRRIAQEVALPDGYWIDWSGQFENLERAQRRLGVIVPITLALIFCLLYLSLGKMRDVLIIYSGIPFAAIGGIAALWLRGMPFSVSAAVGFIALSGIAVLNGQVLIAAIRSFRAEGALVTTAVLEAGKQRFRPVLATAITDAAGFLPMAISTGVGAEVQRPLATVVIGGILTATLLTLVVVPILYTLAHRDPQDNVSATPAD